MKNIRLFFVDDNQSLIDMMKEYFEDRAGFEVVNVAYDGEEGFKYLKEHGDMFDIMILDLIMPKKDGVTVLEEMKKLNIDKKVIVLTSYNTQEMIRKVSELGVNYFILKN